MQMGTSHILDLINPCTNTYNRYLLYLPIPTNYIPYYSNGMSCKYVHISGRCHIQHLSACGSGG